MNACPKSFLFFQKNIASGHTVINESSIYKSNNSLTSALLNDSIPFFNYAVVDHVYFPDKKELYNESLTILGILIFIENLAFYSKLSVIGENNTSVIIRNCLLAGNLVLITSVQICQIYESHFKLKALHESENFHFILEVSNIISLNILQTTFSSDDDERINITQSGINITNVSLAEIQYCTFENFQSKTFGSALSITLSILHIMHSHFVSNSVTQAVIRAEETSVNITIFNCSFINNYGGVFEAWQANLALNIKNSIFLNNIGNNWLYAVLSIRCHRWYGCLYTEFFISESKFINNSNSEARSGGLYISIMPQNHGKYYIKSCHFHGNNVIGGVGALYVEELGSQELHIISSTFSNNWSTKSGAALKLEKGNITITDCVFLHNTVPWKGAALVLDNVIRASLFNSTFIGNSGRLLHFISILMDTYRSLPRGYSNSCSISQTMLL